MLAPSFEEMKDQSLIKLEHPNDCTALLCNCITQEANLLPFRHQEAGTIPLKAILDFFLPLGQASSKYKEFHARDLDSTGLVTFDYIIALSIMIHTKCRKS